MGKHAASPLAGASYSRTASGPSAALPSHTLSSGNEAGGSNLGPEQRSLAATSTADTLRAVGSMPSSVSRVSPSTLPSAMSLTQRRIMPAANGGLAITGFSNVTVVQSSTLGEPEAHGRLVTALEEMARAEPVQLFAGRYRLKAEWVQGGQALVVFARDDADGFFQYAIKCGSMSRCTFAMRPASSHA